MAKTLDNLPINYAELMSKEVANISKRIAAPSGDRIRFNGHTILTPDGGEGEQLEVVVLDFVSANLYYDSQYDRDNPQPPACFAIGPEPTSLVPSDNSPDRQSDACASCPQNQFGSAVVGKGKACKNTRLLAVSPVTALDSPDEPPPVWLLTVSPASLKNYDSYVNTLASKHKTVPIGVVTKVWLDENLTYASPKFSVVRPLENAELGLFFEHREGATKRLITEPDVSQYEPPKRKR
jgi:hypothetical protein